MRKKVVKWFRFMLILLGLIIIVSSIIILSRLNSDEPNLIQQFHSDIRNTVYISCFFFFFISVTAFFFLPIYLRRSMQDLITILKDWQNDAYEVEIDLDEKKKSLDKEVFQVLVQMNETRDKIQTFRRKRNEKIIEHYKRIKSLLWIVKEGVLILDLKGKIVFINDLVVEVFPQLEEEQNILENSYPSEIENNLKKLAKYSLNEKKQHESIQCFIPNLKRHITLESALVRNDLGEVTGLVIAVQNIEKRKSERKQEKESERNN